MKKNKTGKYFKYAIGEIILVVIGILIALQINNWNEHRKTIALGKDYISDIKKDLTTDIITFDTAIKRVQRTILKNKSLLNAQFIDEISKDSILSLLKTSFHSTRIYHIDNTTYLKLSNTGFLETEIFNSVFADINNYYNKEYVAYSEYIEWDEDLSIDIFHRDFLGDYKNIDLPNLDVENESFSNIQNEEKSIVSFKEFVSSSEFRNATWANYNRKKAVLDRLIIQKQIAAELIEKINIELKK